MASSTAKRRTKYKAPYPGVMFMDTRPGGKSERVTQVASTVPVRVSANITRRPANPVLAAVQARPLRSIEDNDESEVKATVGAKLRSTHWHSSISNLVVLLFTIVLPALILLTYYHLPQWVIFNRQPYVGADGILGVGTHWSSYQTMIRQIPHFEHSGYEDGDALETLVRGLEANMSAQISMLNGFDHDISGLWGDLEAAALSGNITVWQHGLFAMEMGFRLPRQNIMEFVDSLRAADRVVQSIAGKAELEAKRALQDAHRIGDYGPQSVDRSEGQLQEDRDAFKALGVRSREVRGVLHSVVSVCITRRDAERDFVEELQDIQSQLPREFKVDAAPTSVVIAGARRRLFKAVERLRGQSNISTVLPLEWNDGR